MLIKKLLMKGFRSIRGETVEFANPLIFVGKNGAGKSNLADAFAFLADIASLPLQSVFNSRGGLSNVRNMSVRATSNIAMAVEIEKFSTFGAAVPVDSTGRYAFEIRPAPRFGFEVVREQCVVTMPNGETSWYDRKLGEVATNLEWLSNIGKTQWLVPSSLLLPLLGISPFIFVMQALKTMRVYSIEPWKLREMQDPDTGEILRSDGSNATSVLNHIRRTAPESANRLLEILAGIVPCTTKVRTRKHGKKFSLEFTQEWGTKDRLDLEAFNMSDGTLRAFGILLAVYQIPSPSLIVIEEPEASIHPGALSILLDLIRFAGQKMQVIVTTHSPEVLDAEWLQPENLRLVTWQEGATIVSNLGEMARGALKDHLMGAGELLRSNALQPPALFAADPEAIPIFVSLP
jgi:predicted ATPase